MAHQSIGQISMAEALVRQRPGLNEQLRRIDGLFDWSAVASLLSGIYAAREGRPSYPPLVLFKALLLQQWYSLSDAGLEEALSDRLSFRRFAGLPLDAEVPDHSTLCRFRAELSAHGLAEPAFAEINAQIERRGLMLKRGTLIDATVVEAAVRAPRPAPQGAGSSPLDPDADWTRQTGVSRFGYKAHLGVDLGSGLVRKAVLTAARIHDNRVARHLVSGDERMAYADKAYDSAALRRDLVALGIGDGIMHQARRMRPLTPLQAARNAIIIPVRKTIERTFGTLKRSYRFHRVRYRGLQRNGVHLHLLCLAFNLRRAEVLLR